MYEACYAISFLCKVDIVWYKISVKCYYITAFPFVDMIHYHLEIRVKCFPDLFRKYLHFHYTLLKSQFTISQKENVGIFSIQLFSAAL